MTINSISGENAFEAWSAAAEHLLSVSGAHQSNLVIEITSPTQFDPGWMQKLDSRKVHAKGENPNDVANTIFPAATWRRSADRADLYRRYEAAHARSSNKRWGTYFLRLIKFGSLQVNQLDRGIEVLNNWDNEPGTAIVFHLSSPETDKPQPLGGPCLQLCQLQAWNGRIDMTAVYRNHDYFNKAFANFIGLGRLLEFICAESGRTTGKLVCHSGHAYFSQGKMSADRLLSRAR